MSNTTRFEKALQHLLVQRLELTLCQAAGDMCASYVQFRLDTLGQRNVALKGTPRRRERSDSGD
jgi:hypothetical protein